MQLKKVLAIVLSVVMIIGVMPFAAFAESNEQLETSVASITVNDATTYYDSLAEAIAAVPENGEAATSIKLLADVTVTSTINITNGKMVKIAGSSKTITANGVDPMFHIEGASLEFTGKCTVQSTSLDCTVFRLVGLKDAAAKYSSLITSSTTTVKSEEYGILVRNNNGYADGVYIKIGGAIESGVACIYTNGNIQKHGDDNPATILVNSSSSKLTCTNNLNNSSKDNAAVYAAGYADWTFGAGSVSGPTALYAKCGNFALRGSSFTGKGEKVAYAHNGNGITATGAAVVFETSAGYCDDLTVSITRGIYNSVNSDPIESYAYSTANDAREPVTGFVSAGASFRKNGVATDVSEFYTAELAAKFEAGTAYIQSAEFGGTEGYISDTAPLAKVTRNGKDYYAGNVFGAANKCVAGETVYALGNFTSTSQLVLSTSGVTIDLQGYTVNSNNSFYPIRVQEGADITIKNGTINSTANSYGLSMCKDSTITLADDVTLNGNITNYSSSDTGATANVYGEVNGTIKPSTDDSTVNVYEGATVTAATAINPSKGTVNVSGGTINGAVTKAAAASVVISGGTFSQGGEPLDVSAYLAEGATEDANGVVAQTYVAKVGDDLYDTLAAAVAAASAGDTVKLLGDVDLGTSNITITKNLTIDGNGFTVTNSGSSSNGFVFRVNSDVKECTFENLTITTTAKNPIVFSSTDYASIKDAVYTIDNCTISGPVRGFSVDADHNDNMTINVIDSVISSTKVSDYDTQVASGDSDRGIALWDAKNCTLNIEGSTIQGYKYVINVTGNSIEESRGLDINVNDSTLKGWGALNVWHNGVDVVITDSHVHSVNIFPGTTNSFAAVNFKNNDCTFTTTGTEYTVYTSGNLVDGQTQAIFAANNNTTGNSAILGEGTVFSGEDTEHMSVAVNSFADPTDESTSFVSVTAGTYDVEVPVEYCAHSYKANYDDVVGAYVVEQQAAPNDGTNITVADTISANIYLDEHYYPNGAYVATNYNHNTNAGETPNVYTDYKAVSELDPYDGNDNNFEGNRMISILQAPAQAMEDIIVKVYANEADARADENAISEYTYSAYSYCREIIEGNQPENLKTLAKATLDYAAAAQTYFGYNTDNLANKDAVEDFYGDVDSVDFSTVPGFTALPSCLVKATFVVKSDLEMNLLSYTPITVNSGSIDTNKGGHRFVANDTQNGDYYVVHIGGIEPANMNKTITVGTSEGVLEFTANTMMKLMANSSNSDMVTLAKAMYLYGVAASGYFGA